MLVIKKKIISMETVYERKERDSLQNTFDIINLLIDEFEESQIRWIHNDATGECIDETDLYRLRDNLEKLLSNRKWVVEEK